MKTNLFGGLLPIQGSFAFPRLAFSDYLINDASNFLGRNTGAKRQAPGQVDRDDRFVGESLRHHDHDVI